MAADAAAQLPDSAGAPAAAGGTAAGAGMAVFVRVPGLPDALCVELPSDATVADLRRGAQEQAGDRRVGRLRFAGELLADGSVALADAGIGPQAAVDTEAALHIAFVERTTMVGGQSETYSVMSKFIPATALEGLRVTGEAPPHLHPFFDMHIWIPEDEAPLWVEVSPAEAFAAGIKPGMLFRLGSDFFSCGTSLLNTQDPGDANMQLVRIAADAQQGASIEFSTVSIPPVVTLAVDPDSTLEDALLQVAREQGFTLAEDSQFVSRARHVRDSESTSQEWLDGGMQCGDIDLPEGCVIEWFVLILPRC
eukprot:TRINITY_DN19027_c0_g2_i5.p1 TRINITY_DN19027_c0_g2~~TRINITY_DN19027_c0_g2_i5.p1  ORF type:complete len:308 (+),score=45.72 TRINITY_DN19027_c0_g2_i5:75-998(+)